jgi:hypothetical protein
VTNLLQLKIHAAIQEGDAHRHRLAQAAEQLASIFPLTAEMFDGLADETVMRLDQFIYRFTKLQDAMGTRLFPALVSMITGSDAPRPFLDTLNQLEKADVISSVETWQTLRVLRNNLAHEYPDDKEQCAATLNMLFLQWRQLETMFISVKTYYTEKLLPLLD